jgi:hypothetical protein
MSHLHDEPSVGSSHVVLSIPLLLPLLPGCLLAWSLLLLAFLWRSFQSVGDEKCWDWVDFLHVHLWTAFLFDMAGLSGGQAGLVAFRPVYLTMHATMYETMHCIRIGFSAPAQRTTLSSRIIIRSFAIRSSHRHDDVLLIYPVSNSTQYNRCVIQVFKY